MVRGVGGGSPKEENPVNRDTNSEGTRVGNISSQVFGNNTPNCDNIDKFIDNEFEFLDVTEQPGDRTRIATGQRTRKGVEEEINKIKNYLQKKIESKIKNDNEREKNLNNPIPPGQRQVATEAARHAEAEEQKDIDTLKAKIKRLESELDKFDFPDGIPTSVRISRFITSLFSS